MKVQSEDASSKATGLSKELENALLRFENITRGEISAIKTFLILLIFVLFQEDRKSLESLESSLGNLKENVMKALTKEERLEMEKDPSFFEGSDNVIEDLLEALQQCIANLDGSQSNTHTQ